MSDAASSTRTFTSWKLDVLNTANADPLLAKSPAAFRLLALALTFVRQEERTCYVTNTVAQVKACIRSAATCSAARKLLLATGYFSDTGKRTREGAVIYRVANPRQAEIQEHVILATETLREREAFRKEEERRKSHQKRRATPSIIEDPNRLRPFSDRRDSPSVIEDKHLEPTPGSISHRRVGSDWRRARSDPWGIHEPTLRPYSEVLAERGAK